jgi:hypothetical protein
VLHTIHYYNDQSRKDEMDWAHSKYGGGGNTCRVLVGKSEGKRPYGRPRGQWEDNTKRHVREVRGMTVDLIHLAQDTDK